MRRFFRLAPLVIMLIAAAQPGAARQPGPPQPRAKAAVLFEARTGQVLWAKNPDLRLPPASTTKIMTALLALERISLIRTVTVSTAASATDGSSIWLEEGERLTIEELVYGAMLNSGNDACVAIAEAVAGSETAFARLMTDRARELGAVRTTFRNANGLPDPGHLSTARDLALIAAAALENPVFSQVAGTKVKNIPWPGKDWDRRLINHNKLLWRYRGADGVKTGYTRAAGHCLVASATRDGRRLIAVLLNDSCMYDDAAALLDYGFECFTLVEKDGEAARRIPVANGRADTIAVQPADPLTYAVVKSEAGSIKLRCEYPDRLAAPVDKGDRVGWAALYDRREDMLVRVPLVAAGTVKRKSLLWVIIDLILGLFK